LDTPTASMAANDELPLMVNFIDELIRQAAVFLRNGELHDCTICSERLVKDENGSVKAVAPCGHLFHQDCVMQSLQSTS
jgi:hypothetical protein